MLLNSPRDLLATLISIHLDPFEIDFPLHLSEWQCHYSPKETNVLWPLETKILRTLLVNECIYKHVIVNTRARNLSKCESVLQILCNRQRILECVVRPSMIVSFFFDFTTTWPNLESKNCISSQ